VNGEVVAQTLPTAEDAVPEELDATDDENCTVDDDAVVGATRDSEV